MKRSRRTLPPEFDDFIRQTGNLMVCEAVAMANFMFEGDIDCHCIHNRRSKLGIHRAAPKTKKKKINLKLIEFIRDDCYMLTSKDAAKKIKTCLGLDYKPTYIKDLRHIYQIPSGLDGRFKPGHVSHNKGKPLTAEQREELSKYWFQPGRTPSNKLPVGTVVVNSEGYLVKKVSDEGTQRERWQFLNRLIWEEAYGTIPENCLIEFKDNNPLHCTLDNLMMVTRDEHGAINKYRNSDPEIKELVALNQRLKRTIKDLR